MNTTDLFFNIIRYYVTNDESLLSNKVRSIANEQLHIASQFFEKFIQLPAFTGYDSDNLLQFVLHWYAAARTIITLHKNINDAYTLDDESLNEYIKSLGFIYPEYIPANNKPTFLLELVNLYKIKGSPQALLKLLQVLNYTDVKLLEFWLVSDDNVNNLTYDMDFIYDNASGLPKQLLFVGKQVERMLCEEPLEIRYTYKQFKEKFKDSHWFLSENQIHRLHTSSKLSLPSLTPFFGLFNYQYITKWFETYAIISRLIKQEYQTYLDSGEVYREHLLKSFGKISLLECVLALWWLFYVHFGFIDPITNELDYEKFVTTIPDEYQRHLCYVVDIANELNKDQFVADFTDIFKRRPKTRAELKAKLKNYENKFLHSKNYSILPDPKQIRTLLETINPDLFNWLYNQHTTNLKQIINELWSVLDYITGSLDLALSTFSNTFVFEGTKIYNVINFFKPIYARLINVAYLLELSSFDAVLLDDVLNETVIQIPTTKFERDRDLIFDRFDKFDTLQYLIFTDIDMTISTTATTRLDEHSLLNIRPYIHLNIYDIILHDSLYTHVYQSHDVKGLASDPINFDLNGHFDHSRSLNINDNVFSYVQCTLTDEGFISRVNFDRNGIFDVSTVPIYFDTLTNSLSIACTDQQNIRDQCKLLHIQHVTSDLEPIEHQHVNFDRGGIFDSMRQSYMFDALEIIT